MKWLLRITACIAGCGFLTGWAQQAPSVFTAAQAESGRTAYLSSCGKCHTEKLTGRKGESGELPVLSSLPEDMLKVVRAFNGKVPPLVGSAFIDKWGTTRDLSSRIREAVGGFPPQNSDDQTYLTLTAYILQSNGARPGNQPLSGTTAVELRGLEMNSAKTKRSEPTSQERAPDK